MKYLVHNPYLKKFLQTLDLLCFLWKKQRTPRPIQRILLSNIAHLGDVIISTCVIQEVKRLFPKAEIGFLLHRHTRVVLEDYPGVDYLHTFDHVLLDLSFQGAGRHLQTRKKALQEIRKLEYDVAIDLRPHFPNTIPLLNQANIPIRIGYESGGFSPLLTKGLSWVGNDQYMGKAQLRLLKELHPEASLDRDLPNYPLQKSLLESNQWVICHIGSSDSRKDWKIGNWKELALQLVDKGYLVAFTGKGKKEEQSIQEICKQIPKVRNLCNQLNWKAFVGVIQQARLLISCDSSAVHIAASNQVPTIVLYSAVNPVALWKPSTNKCISLEEGPRLNLKGSKELGQIEMISVTEVLSAISLLTQEAVSETPLF